MFVVIVVLNHVQKKNYQPKKPHTQNKTNKKNSNIYFGIIPVASFFLSDNSKHM